ncbi:hypothetical protein ACFLX1_02330, partial [Chloroflexota bacterium]
WRIEMKNNKILRTLAVAFTLALLLVAIPAAPALAYDRDISLSPSSGKIGDEITITGDDFASSTLERWARIYFAKDEANETDNIDVDVNTYEFVETEPVGLAGDDDEGEFETTFKVPAVLTDGSDDEDVKSGTYYVYVTILTSTGESYIRAVAEFTVIGGEITIDPDEGTVGTEVEISGEDFGEREGIIIEYDGDEIEIQNGDDETDRNGEFENTTIIIPESTAGDHTITVIGGDSGNEVSAVFTVEPEMTISPESGGAGTEVTATGTGFGYRSNIDYVEFDGNDITNDIEGDDITGRNGSLEFTFIVTAADPDTYDLEVADIDGNTGKAEFTISASISLSPTTGSVGTEVTISGAGFGANQAITISFAGIGIGTTVSDGCGSFATSFNVPASAINTYTVKVSDGVNIRDANFTVLTSASLKPITGNVGTEITVSGSGFTAGRQVPITYDAAQIARATVNTGGTFSVTFPAPASIPGDHVVIATDGTISTQLTFTMESLAPGTPVPLEPAMGIKVSSEAYFDWENVTDPSGVTYTLQIASDEDFNSLVREKTDLTDSEYTITKEERLESATKEAPYYWRVKAIDGTSNESGWSGTGSFYVGLSLAMPRWAIYSLFGIGALLLGLVGFWVGRKTSYLNY